MKILAFFLFLSLGFAETHKVTISESRALLVNKDRTSALELLHLARSKYKPNTKEFLDIEAEAERSGKLFFSEAGQRDFELAESALYSGSGDAKANYLLALEGEGTNFQVISGIVRYFIKAGEFEKAQTELGKGLILWPYWPEFKWLNLILKQRQGEKVEPNELEFLQPKNEIQPFAKTLLLPELIKSGRSAEAKKMARLMIKENPNFPEGHRYLWEAKRLDMEPSLDEGNRYLKLCESMTAKEWRQYRLIPDLCQEVTNVSAEIKKLGEPK